MIGRTIIWAGNWKSCSSPTRLLDCCLYCLSSRRRWLPHGGPLRIDSGSEVGKLDAVPFLLPLRCVNESPKGGRGGIGGNGGSTYVSERVSGINGAGIGAGPAHADCAGTSARAVATRPYCCRRDCASGSDGSGSVASLAAAVAAADTCGRCEGRDGGGNGPRAEYLRTGNLGLYSGRGLSRLVTLSTDSTTPSPSLRSCKKTSSVDACEVVPTEDTIPGTKESETSWRKGSSPCTLMAACRSAATYSRFSSSQTSAAVSLLSPATEFECSPDTERSCEEPRRLLPGVRLGL
eukprot:scaffold279730_cov24-Tisochrysis_lutea.AAC.2